jgi:hypothetical protein
MWDLLVGGDGSLVCFVYSRSTGDFEMMALEHGGLSIESCMFFPISL